MDNANVLQYICNLIILMGGVCGAIVTISHFIGKPFGFFKRKQRKEIEAVVKEVMPAYIQECQKKILEDLQEIIDLNKQQSETLKEQDKSIMRLIESERDNLRYHIMDIYQTYKKQKAFPIYIKEKLDETYNDYKKLNGNHYIDKYYARMQKWQVIDNEEEEEI